MLGHSNCLYEMLEFEMISASLSLSFCACVFVLIDLSILMEILGILNRTRIS